MSSKSFGSWIGKAKEHDVADVSNGVPDDVSDGSIMENLGVFISRWIVFGYLFVFIFTIYLYVGSDEFKNSQQIGSPQIIPP